MEMEVTNLVKALENATAMAKHLQSTTTATDTTNIYAALHHAHRHLSLFLQSQSQPDVDEPMQIAEEEQHQQQQVVFNNDSEDSKMITMEEQMKDFSIQNKKRLKRSTSFDETEQMRWLDYGIESARAQFDYDPHVARLRALDLIYQFHA